MSIRLGTAIFQLALLFRIKLTGKGGAREVKAAGAPCGPPQGKILDKELHIFSTCTPSPGLVQAGSMAAAALSRGFTAGASREVGSDSAASPAIGRFARYRVGPTLMSDREILRS